MERVLKTDTKTISYTFTGYSLGFLTGAAMCGSTFDRLNREFLLAASAIVQAVSIAVAPFTGTLHGFIVVVYLVGIGNGYSNPGELKLHIVQCTVLLSWIKNLGLQILNASYDFCSSWQPIHFGPVG